MSILALALDHAHAADYTCDGIDDLLIAAPTENIGGYGGIGGGDEGAFHVLRGGAGGLSTQYGAAFAGTSLAYLGTALGGGDLDGDGCDEVVVGALETNPIVAPNFDGAIHLLKLTATPTSLTLAGHLQLNQDTPIVAGTPALTEWWGTSIAAADFDGDGFDDLVLGVRFDSDVASSAGSIHYLRGSASGITPAGQRVISQDSPNAADTAEAYDEFGRVLATGDFDADGFADLVIGIPNEELTVYIEGAVQVMYGGVFGPSVLAPDDELWSMGNGGVAGAAGVQATCGAALATGDFDGDGFDDLAVGCPRDPTPGGDGSGSVWTLRGSASGLTSAGSASWHQGTGTIADAPEMWDEFGSALAAGDFDGDGFDDLAIGVPREADPGGFEDGVVHVLFGSAAGLDDAGNVLLPPAVADRGARAGMTLTSGDYDADGADDLIVGVPWAMSAGGAVDLWYGGPAGPTLQTRITQDSPGVQDTVEGSDQFGLTVF